MGVLTTLVSVLVILLPTVTSLSCVDQICDSTHVCKLQFQHGVLASNHCDWLHAHGHHPKCSDPFPPNDHCHCDDEACMNRLYALMTTAVTIDMTTADPMVNPTAAPTQVAISTLASVVTTTAQPPVTTMAPQTSQPVVTTMVPLTSQPVVTTMAPLATTTMAPKTTLSPVTMAPTTQELPTTASFQCIDHETKCSDTLYLSILCKATDQPSKDYALATCPKACNLCGSVGSLDQAFG
ncbi:low-density lipoprotein receptor 1-like [Mytilus edulis]|uniref:low-density lipoprotein receptor 1-like n=1 Tax=Mytilus edulis TaxID=6550 RepID=UPI0039EEA297